MKKEELGQAETLLFEVELNPLGDEGCAAAAGRVTQLCCSTRLSEPAPQATRMRGEVALEWESGFLLEEGSSRVAFVKPGGIFNYFVLGLAHLR